jgi:arylsulfatase A-like enzyme
MGDNGMLEGEHGMVDKRTAHEPSLRIPLNCAFPGAHQGPAKVIEQAGPHRRYGPQPARTLRRAPLPRPRQILGQARAKRRSRLAHGWFYHYNYEKQFPYTPNVRSVRTDDWKYIHYPHGDGSPTSTWPSSTTSKTIPARRRTSSANPNSLAKITELKAELAKLMLATGLTPRPTRCRSMKA